MSFLYRIAAVLAVLAPLIVTQVNAQAPERRFALVIGNSEYKAGRLPTAANDAGLIAETLRTAGFDVAGARDLDQDTLRRSIREFLDKVSAAGPQAVSFIYLAGYGLQFEGENYIVPIDATIRRDEDIPIEAIRISDFTRPLAATPGAVKLFVVDAARQHPFTPEGAPLASGLALVEPDPSMLIAFNAAPGSIASIENGPYGAFAQALAEMIGTGGLGLDDVFARVRLRVNEMTNGIAVPWYASKITLPFLFTERTPDAPPPPQVAASAELQSQPIREFRGDQEAYVAALERDTLGGYEEFIGAFPDSAMAPRVRALIAVRREAVTWRRTVSINTQEAYWSYLQRYPQGAHVADAERRLARLAAAYDPPPSFVPTAFADVEPPPPDEVVYLSQPVVVFDGPGFLPPPPLPAFFCPPPPPEFVVLAPPPPPIGAFFLPAPVVPLIGGPRPWVRPPAFVLTPPRPPIQQITINNTTIINQRVGGGGAALVSASLPSTVVTRVNSGVLKAPPPAAPPPPPIRAAALPGATTLGKTVTLPPRQTSVPGAQSPGLAPGNTRPTTGPNTATTTPGGGQSPGLAPGNTRPTTGPNTATTTPGRQPPGVLAPGNTRPTTGPNTTTTTPGGQPPGVLAPGNTRPTTGPNTATTTPGGQPPGVLAPGNTRPTTGPNTATTTPGGQPPGVLAPGNTRPTTGPNTATTTPGGQPPGVLAPGNTRPTTGPNTATTTPGGQPPGVLAPGNKRPATPPAATNTPPVLGPGDRRLPGPSTATTTPGPSGPGPGATPPAQAVPQINRPAGPPPRTPQVVNRPPPAADHAAPPSPPAGHVNSPPPPPVTHTAPPPPQVTRPAPPPPPQVARPAPPPPPAVTRPAPPPPAARIAPPQPPPPVARAAPPPAVARPAPPPAAAKKCVVQNGKQVCN